MCSTSLVVTEMQIKTTMKCPFTRVRMTSNKKTRDKKCGKGVKKRECKLAYHLENSMKIPQETKNRNSV